MKHHQSKDANKDLQVVEKVVTKGTGATLAQNFNIQLQLRSKIEESWGELGTSTETQQMRLLSERNKRNYVNK